MTLTQLRYLCEIVRQGLHLSRAADAVHTSQPGVSKQIQLLEQELGVAVFKRRKNRLLELTPAGQAIYKYAERVLLETENIRSVSGEFEAGASGKFTIASVQTQALYVLPRVIGEFAQRFPAVRLEFWQGNRQDVFRRVDTGEADLAIGTDSGIGFENVVLLQHGVLNHSIVAQPDHPVFARRRPTLEQIVKYPIITHAFDADGRWKLADSFEARGLSPNIVFRATDATVCKAYIELGLGIAILASVAFDKNKDKNLRAMPADHLFNPEPLYVGLNRKRYHRRFVFDFIEMLAPTINRKSLENMLSA